MRLTTVTHMALDGVVQGLGGSDEDPRDGFTRGGWALPLMTPEGGAAVGEIFQRGDAFLLGRRTYETWVRYWALIDDPSNPIASALNARPKYVASNTLTDPTWTGTTVLRGDAASSVKALKASSEGELQVHGSPTLVRALLDAGLVDEMVLLIYPRVIGQGRRLFPDQGPDVALDLLSSTSTPTGVTIQTYRVAGKPTYAS